MTAVGMDTRSVKSGCGLGKAVPAMGSYRGASPESEPEIKAIRQVAESEALESWYIFRMISPALL